MFTAAQIQELIDLTGKLDELYGYHEEQMFRCHFDSRLYVWVEYVAAELPSYVDGHKPHLYEYTSDSVPQDVTTT